VCSERGSVTLKWRDSVAVNKEEMKCGVEEKYSCVHNIKIRLVIGLLVLRALSSDSLKWFLSLYLGKIS
jgi:hypothetical protein